MNNNPKKQGTTQIQTKLRFFDNAFHRVITCLERLELYLEVERLKGEKPNVKQTAIGTSRDFHDDVENIPSLERYFSELELQCMTLNIQSKSLIGEEVHDETIKFFYKDLLEWYGGRSEQMPFNEVEAAIIPIMLVLNHQSNNKNFTTVYDKYVAKTIKIDELSDEEQRNAVNEGMIAFIKGQERVHEEFHKFMESNDEDVKLTEHRRGEAVDGYKRIVDALTTLFDEVVPAKVFVHTINAYLPDVTAQCLNITEDSIDALVDSKHKKQQNAEFQEPEAPNETKIPANDMPKNESEKEHYIDPSLDVYVEGGITYHKLHIVSPTKIETGSPLASNQNPEVKLPTRKRNVKSSFWKHSDDGCNGFLYVGEDANLLCGKCGKKHNIFCCTFGQNDGNDGLVSYGTSVDNNQYPIASPTMLMVRIMKMVRTTGVAWMAKFFGNLENTSYN